MTFSRAKFFERAWQLDQSAPRRAKVIPDTTIVVSRNSLGDFQDRQIFHVTYLRVWLERDARA